MHVALAGLVAAGLLPLILAWRSYRASSLAHALAWAIIAWLGWGIAFLIGDTETTRIDAARYCALCLTGCAGVAVLGARRPHVVAWNFVVLGLFAVMVWPLVEAMLIGTPGRDPLRTFFLAATIAVGIVNYLPTRLAPAALLLGIACAGEMVLLFTPAWLPGPASPWIVAALLAAVPWVAWSCRRKHAAQSSAFDRTWLDFRDAWGLMWSQRVREQFNRAAENAGSPARLGWSGLREGGNVHEGKLLEILRALLQRFITSAEEPNRGN